MNLTIDERERLAYIRGDVEQARLLVELLDNEALLDQIELLEMQIKDLQHELGDTVADRYTAERDRDEYKQKYEDLLRHIVELNEYANR